MYKITGWSLVVDYEREDGSWTVRTIEQDSINNKYVESAIDEYLHEFEDELNGILPQWSVEVVTMSYYGIVIMILMKKMSFINY